MPHNLNLPKPPTENMRWRVVKDVLGSPNLRLERKGRWFWRTVEQEYIALWYDGNFANRARSTAHGILQKRGGRDTIPYGEVE